MNLDHGFEFNDVIIHKFKRDRKGNIITAWYYLFLIDTTPLNIPYLKSLTGRDSLYSLKK